jgi:hypothetical protein
MRALTILSLTFAAYADKIIDLDPLYEGTEAFLGAFITAYEGKGYVFPNELCFNETTTDLLDMDATEVVVSLAKTNPDITAEYIKVFLEDYLAAVKECQVGEVISSLEDQLTHPHYVKLITRAYWNSILFFRSLEDIKDAVLSEDLNGFGTALGKSLQWLLPPTKQ